jgi:EAL domain-containing protein (putative c-di-GMP-specific phosphodiesterase class I)
MRTCAEGVETAEQLAYLRAEGCDELQGFYFGHPVPAAEITRVFAKFADAPLEA